MNTGMNPKAIFGNIPQQTAGYCIRRFAGLFNLQSSVADDLQAMLFVIVPTAFGYWIIRLTNFSTLCYSPT
jgi:hypothetical protein